MDKTAAREKLKSFICSELLQNPNYPLTTDEPLITSGLIDSFAIAHLGVFVENNFQVYIPDTDLTVDNLNTIDQMVDCIEQAMGGGAA